MSRNDDVLLLDYESLLHTTEAAALINFGDEEVWIPYSLIENVNDFVTDRELMLKRWFVEKKALESYVKDGYL